ncbi:hypothetical protein NEOLI_005320 [Neolecta irregularis DAH-3]|uniref:Nudix hydrolase domain-containing protein n=1 Tax=Neolecta irregularis (strain DAH-3) TaxID=1198029 RepID=A0A1U7LLS4_NEOID|nr:hypothetical protein NEOLI_005320 [Neolecta irregularis DAH-3]|eukprot:OLL23616.1 hypothetical protein NEOLI_005320 [Neolecta irregularis DAH-3]
MHLNILQIISQCDSFSFELRPQDQGFIPFLFGQAIIGYVRLFVQTALKELPDYWEVHESHVSLSSSLSTFESRTKAIEYTLNYWRERGTFQVLKGWRNELYPVYGPNKTVIFAFERAACSLFGLLTFGSHMTAYIRDTYEMWIPRRSKKKPTYPGMLDNTVAGGIAFGSEPYKTIVKEGMEEAGFEMEVMKNVKAVGFLNYCYASNEFTGGEIGLLQPELEFIYDLAVSRDIIPKPVDGEVESFELMTVEQVKAALAANEFKTNCRLVIIDFFVRHGILTMENEPDYIEIISRLRKKMPFPLP